MAKSKQQIIDEISAHIQKSGGNYGEWYVSTGTKGREQLFGGHKVREKGDRWILRRTDSPEVAHEVQSYFVSTFATDGKPVADQASAAGVYAYRKAPHTTP